MSITWNGVSSDTIGVIVEKIPNRYVPTRRFSPQQVAGRNGNILLVDKAFPNVEQEYEVYLSAESQGLPSVARACAEWLMGPDGYCRLEDSYDTTVYREAFLMGGYDLENILNKFGRCTITFSCKPQKYLLTGDTPIEIPAGITTYTGDVVQFDGVTGASITSMSTTITPTQDLHGYANPWPAGGGVNLVDPNTTIYKRYLRDVGGGSYFWTYSSDSASIAIKVDPETSYTLSRYLTTGGIYRVSTIRVSSLPSESDTTDIPTYQNVRETTASAFGSTRTITTDASATYIVIQFNGATILDFVVHGQFERGSTATEYSTYENICPITGLTGLSVYVSPTQDPDDATVYNVDWSSQAGTVYGGTVDVVTGLLTVDTVCATKALSAFSLVETKTNTKHYRYFGNFFGSSLPLDAESGNLCNIAPNAYNASDYVHFYPVKSNGRIEIWVPIDLTTSTEVQIAAPIATPVTYQLTPQEIEVLVGENNVWTSSGPVSVTVVAPFVGTVTNPTPFEARPMLDVSGVGEITINGKTIQILEAVSDFNIDCESMEAEDNSKIYCMDFPYLEGGENEIAGDGSITALTVTPRWWTL